MECKNTKTVRIENDTKKENEEVKFKESPNLEKSKYKKNLSKFYQVTVFEKDLLENGCFKSKEFLKRLNITKSLCELISCVKGKWKTQAIDTINRMTGMNKLVCDDFLQLVIKESKIKVCRDVDSDGFISGKYFK